MAALTYAEFIAVYPSTGMTQTQIEAFIAVAQATLERYIGRALESATYTQTDDGANLPFVMLQNTPITSITSWSWLGDDGSSTAIDSTSYRFDPNTGKLGFIDERYGRFVGSWGGWNGSGWTDGPTAEWGFVNGLPDRFRNSVVVYVGGYSVVPADIKQLLRDMVSAMIANGAGGSGPNFSYQSETLGSYSYSRGSETNPDEWWQMRASIYRRVYV